MHVSNACRYQTKFTVTHELLGLTAVLDLNVRLASLVDDLEGEVLHVRLDLCVLELAADETLRVEDGVVWVHRDLVLGGIADQPLVVREGHIRGCCPVTLVVGNDFDTVVLPDTDTSAKGKKCCKNLDLGGNSMKETTYE